MLQSPQQAMLRAFGGGIGQVSRNFAKITPKYEASATVEGHQARKFESPAPYQTRAQYDKDYAETREYYRVAGKEDGIKPTWWQRRMLVTTGVFGNQIPVPQYVTPNAMKKMHNRLRAFAVVMLTFIVTTAYCLSGPARFRLYKKAQEGKPFTPIDAAH